jgi:hypothetical protein
MTRINDLKGAKAIPQSNSLSALMPVDLVSDEEMMGWINGVNADWNKHVFMRMDEDEKLWTQEPYVLKDASGKQLEDVINVTMNDARVFGERVLAVLNESKEVIAINGQKNGKEMSAHQTAVIEDWWKDLLYLANEHLNEVLMPDFDAYAWEQIAIRGRVGARILLFQDRNGFDVDILPIDMRKCVYTVGRYGLTRVAFWDPLDKDACKQEYPEYQTNASTITRWDCWDSEYERIYLNGELYDVLPNNLGHPPFVIQLCQQGTFLDTSSRALRMRGDSLFSSNRDLYPELNRISSILQTMNMLSLAPPQVFKSESGKKLPSEPLYRLGRILAVQTTEGLEKIDGPDINGSTRFFMATLGGALQRGSISNIDWGNLQFQLSQVAIATLAGASKQVFTPRLKTMARFKRLMVKEALWQFNSFDMKADIGRSGKKRTYTRDDLAGNYTVDFEYLPNLPEETAATYGLAQMAQRWMDDRSIRKTILKYADYDDIDEKFLVQTAQKVSRALGLFQMAQALDKQGRSDEAKVLLVEMGQALQGIAPEEVTRITGVEAPQASPEQKANALMVGNPGPVEGAVRTTRKAEPPGAGEIEPEVGL